MQCPFHRFSAFEHRDSRGADGQTTDHRIVGPLYRAVCRILSVLAGDLPDNGEVPKGISKNIFRIDRGDLKIAYRHDLPGIFFGGAVVAAGLGIQDADFWYMHCLFIAGADRLFPVLSFSQTEHQRP